jgi:predicted glycosyltransferase involved in capsule biosynthesis
MGARNLGGSQTTSDILLFLDWDHLITENLINEIFTWTFNNQSLYLFLKTALPLHHPLWDQDPKTFRKVKDGTRDHLGEYHGTPGTKGKLHPLVGCDYDEWLQKTQVIQLRDKKSKLKASDPSAFCLSRELWYKVGGFDEDFAGEYGDYDRTFRKNLYNYKAKEITMNKAPLISLKEGRTRNVARKKRQFTKRNKKLYKEKTRSFYTPISPVRFKYTKQYEHFI